MKIPYIFLYILLHGYIASSTDPWIQRNYDSQRTSQIYSPLGGLQSHPYLSWNQKALWNNQDYPENDQIIVNSAGFGYYFSQLNQEETAVICVNNKNGSIVWQFTGENFIGTPTLVTVDGQQLLITAQGNESSANITAFSATNGGDGPLWWFPIDGYSISSLSRHTVYNDTVVFTTIHDNDDTNVVLQVQALQIDVSNPNLRWTWSSTSWLYDSMIIPTGAVTDSIGNSYALFFSSDLKLCLATVDFAGTLLWTYTMETVTTTPYLTGITADGIVTVWDGTKSYLINTNNQPATSTVMVGRTLAIHNSSFVYYQGGADVLGFVTSNGQVLWNITDVPYVTGAAIVNEDVVYASVNGYSTLQLWAISFISGTVLWKIDLPNSKHIPTIGTPVILPDGTLVIKSNLYFSKVGCCSGNGICSSSECICKENYYADDCSAYCVSCGPNQHCNDNGLCECDEHYFPKGECSTYCSSNITCSGNGECDQNGICQCKETMTGSYAPPYCKDYHVSIVIIIALVIGVVVGMSIIIALCQRYVCYDREGYKQIQ